MRASDLPEPLGDCAGEGGETRREQSRQPSSQATYPEDTAHQLRVDTEAPLAVEQTTFPSCRARITPATGQRGRERAMSSSGHLRVAVVGLALAAGACGSEPASGDLTQRAYVVSQEH